jgi:hypothetical protein
MRNGAVQAISHESILRNSSLLGTLRRQQSGWRAPGQKVHVICSSVNADGSATNLSNDAAEVGMEILFEIGPNQSGVLLRTEDEMHQQIGCGVRHRFLSPLRGLLRILLLSHGSRRGLYSFRRSAALHRLIGTPS